MSYMSNFPWGVCFKLYHLAVYWGAHNGSRKQRKEHPPNY